MKTIEQKAKAYDNALKVANKYKDTHIMFPSIKEEMFPELAESEDARIRRFLIKCVEQPMGTDFLGDIKKEDVLAWLEKQGECHISHDDEIMIEQLTEYFTTGHGLQNTNETVVEFLKGVKEKLEKQGEHKPNPVLDIEIPFGAKDSELQEASYHIPEGFHAEIEGNRVVIKRGEQKPYASETMNEKGDFDNGITRMMEKKQKPVDRIEPKFNVGDWVVSDYCMGKVIEITNDAYLLDTEQGIPLSNEHNAHLWTIQDAKDGDVLVASDKSLFIYDGSILENGSADFHIAFTENMGIILNSDDGCGWEEKDSCHPATKIQRDLLFRKMKEAGYEWDAEKKELKKIEEPRQEYKDISANGFYVSAEQMMQGASYGELTEFEKALARFSWRGIDVDDLTPEAMNLLRDKYAHAVLKEARKQFIEEACSWLENNLQGIVGGSIYIEDFRKYMKGE